MSRPSIYEVAGGHEAFVALAVMIRWATREINRYSPFSSAVESGMPMPRWSWEGLQK